MIASLTFLPIISYFCTFGLIAKLIAYFPCVIKEKQNVLVIRTQSYHAFAKGSVVQFTHS